MKSEFYHHVTIYFGREKQKTLVHNNAPTIVNFYKVSKTGKRSYNKANENFYYTDPNNVQHSLKWRNEMFNHFGTVVWYEATKQELGRATKKQLTEMIMAYDAGDIHDACEAVGHPTSWELFDSALRTYSKYDMLELLTQLEKTEASE